MFSCTGICGVAQGTWRARGPPGRALMPRRSLPLCKPSPDCAPGNVSGYCSALQSGYHGHDTESASQSLCPGGTQHTVCTVTVSYLLALRVKSLKDCSQHVALTFRRCNFPGREEWRPTCWKRDGLYLCLRDAFCSSQCFCKTTMLRYADHSPQGVVSTYTTALLLQRSFNSQQQLKASGLDNGNKPGWNLLISEYSQLIRGCM